MTGESGMAVGELSRRTGLSTAAINFYVREGLLPPPVKTSATRAVYEESYVDRIGRINELKAQGLTLKVIARVLDNPDPAGELGITRPTRQRVAQAPVEIEAFIKETGLTGEHVYNALDLGLLDPVEGRRGDSGLRFDSRDITTGRAIARLLAGGVGFDLLARHAAEFEPLTRAETHFLAEHVAAVRRSDTSRRAAQEAAMAFARIRDYLRARQFAEKYPEWLDGV
ncbi:MAG: MerR family transcriptional regulator [Chloroflexi bacterium]|nr:MerR family transcriptional regulator [Chloroflexota bacterium]